LELRANRKKFLRIVMIFFGSEYLQLPEIIDTMSL